MICDHLKYILEIPPDVSVIIEQHHERPDGNGFPNGINFKRISVFSSIFIVAHDFVKYVMNNKQVDVSRYVRSSSVIGS